MATTSICCCPAVTAVNHNQGCPAAVFWAWNAFTYYIGGIGLLVGIGLWWVYFDFIARRPPKPSLSIALSWVYLHLATLAAITVTGAAKSVGIADTLEGNLDTSVRHLLAGSVGAALLGLSLLELTLHREQDEPAHPTISPNIKAVAAATVLVAGTVDLGWSTTSLLIFLACALAVPAIHGATVWYAPDNTQRLGMEGPTS